MARKVIAEYEADGYPCTIVRGTLGALCGYVDVPAGHPWHGLPTWDEGRDLTGVEADEVMTASCTWCARPACIGDHGECVAAIRAGEERNDV